MPVWSPERPRLHPVRLVIAWLGSALGLMLAAAVVPGAELKGFGGAVAVAAIVGVLNAVLPPLIAALRLPVHGRHRLPGWCWPLDAVILRLAADITPQPAPDRRLRRRSRHVADRDGDQHADLGGRRNRRRRRVRAPGGEAGGSASRSSEVSDTPGFLFLEIDGLALPVLRRAIRDGNTPNMARWLARTVATS